MGWKGALRSINAEMNRQSREAEKRHRQYLKEVEREEASEIVLEQEEFLYQIVSLHQECRAHLDWETIENKSEPLEPVNVELLTRKAIEKLDNLKPNIIEKVFQIQSWRKKRLLSELEEAKKLDEETHLKNMAAYEHEKSEWKKQKDIAKRLNIIEILKEKLDIEDLPIGKDVQFVVSDEMHVDVNLKVFPFEEVIPSQEHSLRQSGSLSTKNMPKGKGLELYQDHVCSTLLRVARETLGTIPQDMVRANALINAVNPKTGHLENQVIVSLIVVRETLNRLNLNHVDPSDALSNFIYNMKFRKTKGFESVEKVDFP